MGASEQNLSLLAPLNIVMVNVQYVRSVEWKCQYKVGKNAAKAKLYLLLQDTQVELALIQLLELEAPRLVQYIVMFNNMLRI